MTNKYRFSADVELPLLQMALQTEQYAQAMSVRPRAHNDGTTMTAEHRLIHNNKPQKNRSRPPSTGCSE